MKKKKTTGIDYLNLPPTIPDLLAAINSEYEKRKEDLKARQEIEKTNLIAAMQKEKSLTNSLKKNKEIIEKMCRDFSGLETNVEKVTKKEVEKGVLREADVRSGKISLREFNQQGKREKQISKEIVEKVTGELESESRAIRNKNLEILNLQKELFQCKQEIRRLILRPGFLLLETLRGIKEFGDEQIIVFMEGYPDYQIELGEIDRKLQLTEGKSVSRGQNWDRQTAKEARKIAFDPCLPVDLIPNLRSQLAEFADADIVNVRFYFREHEVEVESIERGQTLIRTGSRPIPEKEIVTTRDLE